VQWKKEFELDDDQGWTKKEIKRCGETSTEKSSDDDVEMTTI